MQALYELDLTGHPWQDVLRRQSESLPEGYRAIALAEECTAGVLKHRQELDEIVHRLAPAWPVGQLAVVDRNILRLALYELRIAASEPPKVIINEAVELAKIYGSETSSRFINGVLGSALAEELAESG